MDFSHLKKVLAGVSTAAIMLTQVGTAVAAYSDVPSGVWYEDAVSAFSDAGYLDASQSRFRGGDFANRAEFVKLVVELNGGILSTPPAVPSFDDVATGAWYYGYMEEAGKEGWVKGDGDCYGDHPCYARPGANINRAEAAALIVRSFGLESTGDASQFVDNPSGQWYTSSIQTAADHCVLQGDDSTGRVRPGDNMNRAEMVVMLYRVDQGLTFGVDCGTDVVQEPMIRDIVSTSSTTVEVEFNVALDETAALDLTKWEVVGPSDEIAVSSAEMIGTDVVELTLAEGTVANANYTLTVTDVKTADGEEFSDAMDFAGYTEFVQGNGILELSLAASNPVGDTVPKGAIGVVMLSTEFSASCDDSVIIENLTVLHEGFGPTSDIDGLYASINGARVTRKRSVDSQDQTADLRFSSPLVLDPCESVTVDIVADFSLTAGTSGEHNLVVELPSDVFSNAKSVTGNFPLRGKTFRVAAVASGEVTVTYRTVSPDQVQIGDKGVVVGKFEVSTDSVEDQTLYSATIEQNSSASDGDIANLAIRRSDGTVLTNTVAQTVGDFATLVFDPPFTILQGDKITLEIVADVVGGAGDSVQLNFEEASDLFAVGSLYGYGLNGQLYGSQVEISTSASADIITIDAGEFTIGINGPTSQDYTRDDNDAVLANVTFKTGGDEDIDVKSLFVAVQGQTSTGAGLGTAWDISDVIEDVEMRNKSTGRTVDGIRLTSQGTATSGDFFSDASETWQVYRFDDFIVRGTESWEFRVDFIDNQATGHPASGDKFRIHICGEPTDVLASGALTDNTTGCDFGGLITAAEAYQMQVEGLSTGDKVGDVRPRGNLAGNFQHITAATLTIAGQTLNSTDSATKNAKNVNLLRFEARAGQAEDILITKLIFESALGSLQNGQNYTLWADADGDGNVDTQVESGVSSQSDQVAFNSLAGGGYIIPAEETVVFEVHSDMASNFVDSNLQIRFDTGSTSYIEAEELDDGSALSGIKTNAAACGSTSCDIVVSTAYSVLLSLVNQGDLYVTKSDTGVRSRQLLGGTLGEEILRLEFHADNEDIDVTDLQITSSGSTASSVNFLELYKVGQSTPFATATTAGCPTSNKITSNGGTTVTTFCANMQSQQLVVPDGSDVEVLVRPRMKADTNGATTGQKIALFVGSGTSINRNITIEAEGAESSNPLSMADSDGTAEGEVFIGRTTPGANANIVGNPNVTVLSKITSITNANSDPNGTAVPEGQNRIIGKFQFTAAAHSNSNNGSNDATLSGIVFNITATNMTTTDGGFEIYNEADSTDTVVCTEHNQNNGAAITTNASGSFLVRCTGLITDSMNSGINQGTSATFVLQADVASTQIGSNTSTLQVSLTNFESITRTAFGVTSTASHIWWSDIDSSTQGSAQQFLWIEYPTTSVSSTTYVSG